MSCMIWQKNSIFDGNLQFIQLGARDLIGCIHHQIHGAGCFRKSNYISYGFTSCEQHDQTVESKSDASMGWCSIFKSFQKETELFLGFLGRKSKSLKHFLLYIPAENTD